MKLLLSLRRCAYLKLTATIASVLTVRRYRITPAPVTVTTNALTATTAITWTRVVWLLACTEASVSPRFAESDTFWWIMKCQMMTTQILACVLMASQSVQLGVRLMELLNVSLATPFTTWKTVIASRMYVHAITVRQLTLSDALSIMTTCVRAALGITTWKLPSACLIFAGVTMD